MSCRCKIANLGKCTSAFRQKNKEKNLKPATNANTGIMKLMCKSNKEDVKSAFSLHTLNLTTYLSFSLADSSV